jgi:hypothetical protein
MTTQPQKQTPQPIKKNQKQRKRTDAEMFAAFERTKPNPRIDLLLAGITEREWF